MAKVEVYQCDECKRFNEFGIIKIKGDFEYQRSKKNKLVSIKNKDICLKCLVEKLSETSVTMIFGDETY